jgi:hypothetical protein
VQNHRATAHALQSDGRTQALQDVLLLQAAAHPQQHMFCEQGLILHMQRSSQMRMTVRLRALQICATQVQQVSQHSVSCHHQGFDSACEPSDVDQQAAPMEQKSLQEVLICQSCSNSTAAAA